MENELITQEKPVILIAEDDDSNYFYVKEILSSFSIELIRAFNGIEAVEICRKNAAINLILMDLKMPLMNGYEATRQIKTRYTNKIIIAISAYIRMEEEAAAREAGCDDFIAKPFPPKRIEEVINKYLVGMLLQRVN
jgi:two-component system, cell cycle response regulator DivK